MAAVSPSLESLTDLLKSRGQELGFSLVGIAPAARPDTFDQFRDWLGQGLHATMNYLPRRLPAYEHPQGVQKGVKSIVVAAMNYGPGSSGPDVTGRIAAYAQGSVDYHDLVRERLSQLAAVLHEHRPGCRTRVAVDTAPLLERDLARRAGLGWFGKNTMLINKWSGSYFFLGAILTDCELPPDAPHETSHCGTCTRCLEACPTDAFPAPHVLDAGRCISYLTIELRGQPIPELLRSRMQDWMFGCDVCQQVCPWNRKASPASVSEFKPSSDQCADAAAFLMISEAEFEARYGKTPLSRPGWEGMARNAAIVLGNQGDEAGIPPLIHALHSSSPIVRGAAAWALGRISSPAARQALLKRQNVEGDASVREEIANALNSTSPET